MTKKQVFLQFTTLIGGAHYWKKPTQKLMVVMIKLLLAALKLYLKASLAVMHLLPMQIILTVIDLLITAKIIYAQLEMSHTSIAMLMNSGTNSNSMIQTHFDDV